MIKNPHTATKLKGTSGKTGPDVAIGMCQTKTSNASSNRSNPIELVPLPIIKSRLSPNIRDEPPAHMPEQQMAPVDRDRREANGD
jgi:hypothetical protein